MIHIVECMSGGPNHSQISTVALEQLLLPTGSVAIHAKITLHGSFSHYSLLQC